jgi:HK97 family phage major capsid protein
MVDVIGRSDAVIIPEVARTALINGTVRQSAALACFTSVPTSTRDTQIPTLAKDIEARWVADPIGLKSVDAPKWKGEPLTAEEIAVVVPVPLSVIADETFHLTAAMSPLFTRAMARAIDRAALFGTAKPPGWTSPSLLEAATAAGNLVEATADPIEDLLDAAELPSVQGYIVNRAITRPGWQFAASRSRNHSILPNPDITQPFPLVVSGLPLYTDPPSFEAAKAVAFVLDASNALIGLRQDLTISVHPDGIISDADGKVLFNATQQDSLIYRAVMRVGFALVNPPTDAGLPAAQRSPVAAVIPAPPRARAAAKA